MNFCIHCRKLLQAANNRTHEKAHKAKTGAMLFFKIIFIFSPQGHDRAHIHLVKGGQHRGGVLGLFQTASDHAAQTRHRHPLFTCVTGTRASFCRGRRRGSSCHFCLSTGNCFLNIRFCQTAILTGTGNRCRV